MNGVFISYYQEPGAMFGSVAMRCNYKDDKLNGPYESYFEDGKLATKCSYKEDELDGPYEGYWENWQ